MKNIVAVLFLATLAYLPAAIAADRLDTAFLKEEPYRKTKQKVDMSSVRNAHDVAVVKDAINNIMRFVVDLSFAELPTPVGETLMTAHGSTVLHRPPLRNALKRYSVARIGNWHICGDNQIAFSASFSDLLQKNFWKEDFLFVKTESGWRFDDHRAVECQGGEQAAGSPTQ